MLFTAQASDGKADRDKEGEYFVLIASMPSHVIAAVNLDTGKVEILHTFKNEEGPKGIAVDQAGNLYVSLRYGGQNVLRLTPKEGEAGFNIDDFTGVIGRYGPGKLRMTDEGELLIAGGTMGMIYRYNISNGRERVPTAAANMSTVVGIDYSGSEAYAVEVFGLKLAKFEGVKQKAKVSWLSRKAEPSLKRSTGIAAGHDKNLLVTNTQSSVISEFSSVTGKPVGVFFDLKTVGVSAAGDIRYVPELKSYFVLAGGAIFNIDLQGNF